MKKIFAIMALCALTMSIHAAHRNYLCGITDIKVDTLQSNTKNQFTLTFNQKCKNMAEYHKDTVYSSTVKLVLNSDDRTLEGVYTTEGASTTSSSANVNDQTINLITSEFTSGSTSRLLRKDSISTFTIEKIGENQYAITTGLLYFSKRLDQTTDTWEYRYSYDASEIGMQGIQPKPFVFGWEDGFQQSFYSYDLTVTALKVEYSQTDYDQHRFFLTMQCKGIQRENQTERNYEVQLAIYPSEKEIAGSYATQGGSLLWASNCYVKDLKINKTRNLANDSVSSIIIQKKGDKKYRFTGGPLICTDVDLNYQAVYGKKRIEATHYYYFNDNDGQGIEFTYDEVTGESGLVQGINHVQSDKGQCTKVLRNGRMIIVRDGIEYTVTGSQL